LPSSSEKTLIFGFAESHSAFSSGKARGKEKLQFKVKNQYVNTSAAAAAKTAADINNMRLRFTFGIPSKYDKQMYRSRIAVHLFS